MAEKFILLCSCGWKRISDLSDKDLHELKNDTMSCRKFRCPSCGFAVSPRPAKDPQSELEGRLRERRMQEDDKKWLEESARAREEFMKEIERGQEDNDQ
jgi:hypothetical protein